MTEKNEGDQDPDLTATTKMPSSTRMSRKNINLASIKKKTCKQQSTFSSRMSLKKMEWLTKNCRNSSKNTKLLSRMISTSSNIESPKMKQKI